MSVSHLFLSPQQSIPGLSWETASLLLSVGSERRRKGKSLKFLNIGSLLPLVEQLHIFVLWTGVGSFSSDLNSHSHSPHE